MNPLIPPPDEFGLPAPPWLFQFLLIFTFVLHLVFMNFVLGGMCIQAVALWRRAGETTRALLHITSRTMPIAVSFTITTGVAPLLFVQVLYGQFFYTSNVLLGFVWLGILVPLILAFYGTYVLLKLMESAAASATKRIVVGATMAVFVLAIAYIFTANGVLVTEPERWWAVHTGAASALSPAHPTLLSRYLHNVTSALVVAGLWIAVSAWWWRGFTQTVRDGLVRTGLGIALACSLVAGGTGAWYFFALDTELRSVLHTFGSVYGAGWMTSVVLVVLAMIAMVCGVARPARPAWTYLAALLAFLALPGMALAREGLRLAVLTRATPSGEPAFDFGRFAVRTQVLPMVLFAVLLVAGLVVVAIMLRWLRTGRPAQT